MPAINLQLVAQLLRCHASRGAQRHLIQGRRTKRAPPRMAL